jgi:anti-anti-sigma factor
MDGRSLAAGRKQERLRIVCQLRRPPTMAGCVGSQKPSFPPHVMSEKPISEPANAGDLRHLGMLTLRSTRESDTHVIALSGELDLAGADLLEGELKRVEATDARRIVVDLRDLDFIDSTGVRLIYMADMRSRKDSDRLSIRRGPHKVQRLFVMTDLADRLPFVD